jgi:hypothetical protein
MLQTTNRFQTDIARYRESIDKITNEQEKLAATRLLNDLIYEVKNMDNMYLDMVYAKQLPSLGSDIKNKIVEIRKSLDKFIKKAQ